ncbi:MAG: septal ring lytic transglycosylase RlpA family protein [Chlorobiaceae bacterium]|nr:septal ring lytic transglycosylase RlpA family protein [Chlorobiaceae bacterium]NTW11473.1 septal ring lytic transglycosylase RlpA family protein [Chlorobiaceae bacterium]
MAQNNRTRFFPIVFILAAFILNAFPYGALQASETQEFPDPAKPDISWLPENTTANPASSTSRNQVESVKNHFIAEGKASYYGKQFHGRKTASGEYFNFRNFTAAHRTLAFGTNVKVINLENGKAVIVRINDRGPFMKGRIIDISTAAAKEIGLVSQGTANVRIEAYN